MDARSIKISATMRARKLDNFKHWRDEMKRAGKIKDSYPALKKSGDLAELIGVILGDGHIGKLARCESLRIVSHADNDGFVRRYASLVEAVFGKKPRLAKMSTANAVTITIYEKQISGRLDIPSGSRKDLQYELPAWIASKDAYKIRFLRGLYEAEGSLCHHPPTSTHKLFFSNRNSSLLKLVHELVSELGFKVNTSGFNVQVSRQKEVQELENLLEFRSY